MLKSHRFTGRIPILVIRILAPALLLSIYAAPVSAKHFAVGDTGIDGSLNTEITVGAIVRTQKRDKDLIGTTNVEGQQSLCNQYDGGLDCTTVKGNNSLLAHPGSPTAINKDNGDLNYNQWDFVSGAIKIAPELELNYGQFGLDVSGIYFYDAVNSDFEEYHPNREFQPKHTPRPNNAENRAGNGFELLKAFISGDAPFISDRRLHFKIGNQILNQGESNFLVLNSLNTINPPNQNLLNLPGEEIAEVFRPVPLLVLSTNITPTLSAKAFYQFRWRAARIAPPGSFFSINDIAGAGGRYLMEGVSRAPEDPDNVAGREKRTPGNAHLISNAGRTVLRASDNKPRSQGEYGFSLSYFARQLNYTTFSLYYRNLHSRLPYISWIAANRSCAASAKDFATAAADCNGFATKPGPESNDILPVDTARYYLDYPEDIHTYGFSFSTSLGAAAWSGEIDFRPNQPLQVDNMDIGYAALQPAFPRQSIPTPTNSVIPGRRVAIPDYIETRFRGNHVHPGQRIHGYVRRKTLFMETSFVFLNGTQNPFGASDIQTVVELGAYDVLNMPSKDKLQFAGTGTRGHHSAGVNGTGTPNAQQRKAPPDVRKNPTFQQGHFADAFSWGYRLLTTLDYKNVIGGIDLLPQFGFFHDVHGTSPGPNRSFVGGTMQFIVGLRFNYHNRLFGGIRQTWYTGGGRYNLLNDRDNLDFDVRYAF